MLFKRVFVFLIIMCVKVGLCQDDLRATSTEDSYRIIKYFQDSAETQDFLNVIKSSSTGKRNNLFTFTDEDITDVLLSELIIDENVSKYNKTIAINGSFIETTTRKSNASPILDKIEENNTHLKPITNNANMTETTREEITFKEYATETTSEQNILYEYITETATTKYDIGLETSTMEARPAEDKRKISEHILMILEKFKEANPEGIPGVEILDPCPVPDTSNSITLFDTLYFKESQVYGFSKLRLQHIAVDLENLKVNAAMIIDHLETRGKYRLSSFLMPRSGAYTINITGLKITPRASVGVEIDGKLKTKDIQIDLTLLSNKTSIAVEFVNLGDILQEYMNNAGNRLFEQMKPHVLKQMNKKSREYLDTQLEEVAGDVGFSDTIPPLDMILIDVRKKIQVLGMDPYRVEDYKNSLSFLSVSLTHTWITGLSTFHRKGNVTFRLENNSVTADVALGTQELKGMTVWNVTAGIFTSVAGTASFSIEYTELRVILEQSLDTRQRPLLRGIYLDVGNIQTRCDGAGTLDYFIEFTLNVVPNLIRYQVLAALEGPLLKSMLQEELNRFNVEEELKDALPKINELAKHGFKLSLLRSNKSEPYDEDDFFNF